MNEFALIDAHFKSLAGRVTGAACDLGIGDDAALLTVPHGKQLAVTTDTLIAGVHFFADAEPADVGYKALAVNLSDLAAMGARPAWYTLSLSLPDYSHAWLEGFCRGLETLMRQQPVTLIGGDTTCGPLTITLQAMGLVDSGCALRRDGAKPGDDLYVSGTIGDAGAGLRILQQRLALDGKPMELALERLHRPRPRNALGEALTSLASACIDVSDGLLADLDHLLRNSGAGAEIDLDLLPLAAALRQADLVARLGLPDVSDKGVRRFAACAGDDYELCFSAPPDQRARIEQAARQSAVPVTRFGSLIAGSGLFDRASGNEPLIPQGYRHF